MRILVTGALGFTASYLIGHLRAQNGVELIGIDIRQKSGEEYYVCDLSDRHAVRDIIRKTQPGQIYHLAGSFKNHYDTDYKCNVLATKNILDSILDAQLKCRILLIGSCAEYGSVPATDNPVKEEYPLNPVSVYGLTKVFQTYLMRFYVSCHQMDIVMARVFNLFGKGMSNTLFIGRLYEQIQEYRNGAISHIVVGNLDNRRDYIDVKEAVTYYEAIMNYGVSGEIYNVGSGRSMRTVDVAQKILKESNLSMEIIKTEMNAHQNKIDINDIRADIQKISRLKKTKT